MRVVEMDGAEAETTTQLLDWLTRIRDIKLIQGPTLLLLDDFESFTIEARARIVEWVRKTRGQRHLCPMVVTCTNAKEPSMRSLQPLQQLRLFAPNGPTCRSWFQLNGFEGADGVVRVPTPSCFVGQPQADVLASGDLRRVKIMLQWKTTGGSCVGGCGAAATELSSRSAFEATRRLFLHRASPTECALEWTRYAAPQDVDLVREHALNYVVDDDVHALARLYDTLSSCDASRPLSFTQWDAQSPMTLHAAALAVIADVCTTNVGALFPCGGGGGGRRQPTSRTDLDLPPALRSECRATS